MALHGNTWKFLIKSVQQINLSNLGFFNDVMSSVIIVLDEPVTLTVITMFRQSLKYQSLVEEHLHHGDISSSLCDNLLASFHTCLELAEQIKHAGLQVGKLKNLVFLSSKICKNLMLDV